MTNDEQSDTTEAVLSQLPVKPVDPGPTPTAAAPSALVGPPAGFGAAVNDYFNHYISVADTKAAGFMAAALTVGAAAVGLHPATPAGHLLQWASVALLGGAGTAGAFAIFPRLPSAHHKGLIFWEDVRNWPSAGDYQRALSEATEQDVEFEYAAQNHVVSGVLHRKHVWVRCTIALFMLGTAAALVAYLVTRYA